MSSWSSLTWGGGAAGVAGIAQALSVIMMTVEREDWHDRMEGIGRGSVVG